MQGSGVFVTRFEEYMVTMLSGSLMPGLLPFIALEVPSSPLIRLILRLEPPKRLKSPTLEDDAPSYASVASVIFVYSETILLDK